MINVSLKSIGKCLLFEAGLVGYMNAMPTDDQILDLLNLQVPVVGATAEGPTPPPPPGPGMPPPPIHLGGPKSPKQGAAGVPAYVKKLTTNPEFKGLVEFLQKNGDKATKEWGFKFLNTLYLVLEKERNVRYALMGDINLPYRNYSDVKEIKERAKKYYSGEEAKLINELTSYKDKLVGYLEEISNIDKIPLETEISIKELKEIKSGGISELIKNTDRLPIPLVKNGINKIKKDIKDKFDDYCKEVEFRRKTNDASDKINKIDLLGVKSTERFDYASGDFGMVEKLIKCPRKEMFGHLGDLFKNISKLNETEEAEVGTLSDEIDKFKGDIEEISERKVEFITETAKTWCETHDASDVISEIDLEKIRVGERLPSMSYGLLESKMLKGTFGEDCRRGLKGIMDEEKNATNRKLEKEKEKSSKLEVVFGFEKLRSCLQKYVKDVELGISEELKQTLNDLDNPHKEAPVVKPEEKKVEKKSEPRFSSIPVPSKPAPSVPLKPVVKEAPVKSSKVGDKDEVLKKLSGKLKPRKLTGVDAEMEKLRGENQRLLDENGKLQKELVKIRGKHVLERDELAKKYSDDLRKFTYDAAQRSEIIEKEYKSLERKSKELENKVHELENNNNSRKATDNEEKKVVSEKAADNEENTRLKNELDGMRAEISRLKRELEVERNKKPSEPTERVVRGRGTTTTVENTEKIDALGKELSNRDSLLSLQENALNSKDEEINRLRQRINQLMMNQLNTIQSNEQKPESESNEEMEQRRQELARLQEELESQQDELNSREAELQKREQSLKQQTQGANVQMQNLNNSSNVQTINGGQNESNKNRNVELLPQNISLNAVGA